MAAKWMGVVLVVGVVSVACEDEMVVVAGEDHFPLPRFFHVEASATGTHDLSITCRFEWGYEVNGTPTLLADGGRRVPVRWGGDAQRTILLPDGSGISLWPHLLAPESHVILGGDGSVELITPVNLEDASPFYQGLRQITGSLEADGTGEGTWTCAPFGPGAAPQGGPVEDRQGS